MGIAVVVAANGYGVPVRAVSSGAPVMTVAEHGAPIVLSPRGAPFVINGLVPESPFQDFTVDAGSGNGGDTGYYTTIYGGISAEPLAGYVLEEFATRNSGYFQIAFLGDCLNVAHGWQPVIPGISLGEVLMPWAFDGTSTSCTWECDAQMSAPAQYEITWVWNP